VRKELLLGHRQGQQLRMPQPQRNVRILKMATMKTPSRDLLVLLRNELASEQAIEQELKSINYILMRAESPEGFCMAHELVTRHYITSSSKKILRAIRFVELKPFQFLLNKN
jgi:hypothetical protein